MKRRHTCWSLSLLVIGLLLPMEVQAVQSWDLQTNWSNASNPTGPWSYRDVSGNLFNLFQTNTTSVPSWDMVSAWPGVDSGTRWTSASNPNGVAGVSQNNGWTGTEMNGGVDWPMQRIGGIAYDIRWTAPVDQIISVTGDVWMMHGANGAHTQTINIIVNGVSSGAVNIPLNTRADGTVFTFAAAYGSSFLQNVLVRAGTTLDFIVSPANLNQADFVGMDLHLTGFDVSGDVPEPGTVGCMLAGLTVVGLIMRRRRA